MLRKGIPEGHLINSKHSSLLPCQWDLKSTNLLWEAQCNFCFHLQGYWKGRLFNISCRTLPLKKMTCLQLRFSVSTDMRPAPSVQSQLHCQVAQSTLNEHIPVFKGMFLFHNDVSDTLTQPLPMLRAEFRTVSQRQIQHETLSVSTLT